MRENLKPYARGVPMPPPPGDLWAKNAVLHRLHLDCAVAVARLEIPDPYENINAMMIYENEKIQAYRNLAKYAYLLVLWVKIFLLP